MSNFDKINARNIPKLPIEQAAALLVLSGITKSADFYVRYKASEIPKVIPGDPKGYYADYDGWQGFIQLGPAGAFEREPTVLNPVTTSKP